MNVPPLFIGLTMPPRFLGVTLEYTMLILLGCTALLVFTEQVTMLLLWLPCHVLGWGLCQYDPHIFQVLFKRVQCPLMPLKKIWGCRNYAPY